MDWSTSALMNNSPLAQRLPGQRTPPDPTIEQPNAADLTYGWHSAGSSSSDEGSASGSSNGHNDRVGDHRRNIMQPEEIFELRRRRRARRAEARNDLVRSEDAESSSEGSILSYTSATGPIDTHSGTILAHDTEQRTRGGEMRPQQTPLAASRMGPDQDTESFICRICFDGPASQDDGGGSLGKLIAPCRCRGTMKFVHQACLTRWRSASMRQSSIIACDQCGSPYKFRKSRFVGLATNRLLILFVSCLLFIGLIWSVGYTAEKIAHRWGDTEASSTARSKSKLGGSKASSRDSVWQYVFGEDEEESKSHSAYGYDEDVYQYAYGNGYFSPMYWEPLSYIKLVKAAVKDVGSGRATQAIKDLVQGESQDEQEKEMGWFATLLDDWKYGPSGLWPDQRPTSSVSSSSLHFDEKPGNEGSGSTPAVMNEVASDIKTSAKGERYDAKTASILKPGQRPSRDRGKDAGDSSNSRLWERITLQFSLGFSLVGIFSFINLLLGVSLWGPFQLGNFGLGRSLTRLTGSGRRRGGGGGAASDGGTIASVILLFLVIIGILRALMAVISLTTYLSKRVLARVEDYIVEYSGEEEAMQTH